MRNTTTQNIFKFNDRKIIQRSIPAFKAYISYSNHSSIMNGNFYLLNLVPSLIDCLASQNKPVAETCFRSNSLTICNFHVYIIPKILSDCVFILSSISRNIMIISFKIINEKSGRVIVTRKHL